MKFKNLLLILLSIILVFSLVACGNNNDTGNDKKTNETVSDTVDKENNTTQPSEETKEETENKEELEKKAKEECENALNGVKVELLAKEVIDYKDAYINGYFVYSEDYSKATILTIGISFPKNAYRNHYKDITISGETATGKDGKPTVQTNYDTAWIDDSNGYSLMVIRMGGEVDPSKVDIQLTGKTDGVVVNTKFENNGEVSGFANSVTAFTDEDNVFGCNSSIVKLKGRHYLIVRRFNSSSGWGGSSNGHDTATETKSYVLIPLEGGFDRTLTKNDVKLVISETVANTTANVLVNESGVVDASSLDAQTTIEVEVVRTVIEPENSDGTYSDEVYDKIDEDQSKMFENITLEIDDGDGNKVTLKLK